MVLNGNKYIFDKSYHYAFAHHGLSGAFTEYRHQAAANMLNKIVNKVVDSKPFIDALFRAAGKTPPANLGVTVPASVSAH